MLCFYCKYFLPFNQEYKTVEKRKDSIESSIEFINLLPRHLGRIKHTGKEIDFRIINDLSIIFNYTNLFLKEIFNSYTYIGPLRGVPERRYIYEDEVLEIGTKGENAAYIYYTELDNIIDNYFIYDNKRNTFLKRKDKKLEYGINEWLNLLSIKGFKVEEFNEVIRLNLNSSFTDKTIVNIADVGFGVSQIFPIILEGLRVKKDSTLLLEQPEIHLHPNLQMQLADFFISLVLSNKRVIIETHSDHIINRLVRRIVEDKTNTLNDLIGIYFFKQTEEGTKAEEICIDEKHGIINWPDDFFDQTAREQELIIRAGLKKRNL